MLPKIISVPHSGSRSLLRHLQQRDYRVGYLYHFGDHDGIIARWEGRVAIPIRNPVDTAVSWQVRQRDWSDLWHRYVKLVDFAESNPNRVDLYVVENLPVRVGEKPQARLASTRLAENAVQKNLDERVKEFYRTHGGYTL